MGEYLLLKIGITKKMKKQETDWKKIFAKYLSDK